MTRPLSTGALAIAPILTAIALSAAPADSQTPACRLLWNRSQGSVETLRNFVRACPRDPNAAAARRRIQALGAAARTPPQPSTPPPRVNTPPPQPSSARSNAQVYDAFASFDGLRNGHFRYFETSGLRCGLRDDGGCTMQNILPLGRNTGCTIPDTICAEQQVFNNALVAKSRIGAFRHSSINVPGDALIVHPSRLRQMVVLAFIAPRAGDYEFSVRFDLADRSPTGVELLSFGPTDPTGRQIGLLSRERPSYANRGRVSLRAGESFGYLVGAAGSFSNDATAFNLTVSHADSRARPRRR